MNVCKWWGELLSIRFHFDGPQNTWICPLVTRGQIQVFFRPSFSYLFFMQLYLSIFLYRPMTSLARWQYSQNWTGTSKREDSIDKTRIVDFKTDWPAHSRAFVSETSIQSVLGCPPNIIFFFQFGYYLLTSATSRCAEPPKNQIYRPKNKHCQRHNGSRVLSLQLESFFWLKWIWKSFSWKITQVMDSIPWARCAFNPLIFG